MMNDTHTYYTIRQIAAQSGLSAYTLRYYEDIGLIDPVTRAANGHRRYTQDDLNRVLLLKRLRMTGMPLDEMKLLIDLYREGDGTVTQRKAMMQAHRAKVQAQIDELYEVATFIDYKIGLYEQQEQTQHERLTGQDDEVPAAG